MAHRRQRHRPRARFRTLWRSTPAMKSGPGLGAWRGWRGQRVKNIVHRIEQRKGGIIRWDPHIKLFPDQLIGPSH